MLEPLCEALNGHLKELPVGEQGYQQNGNQQKRQRDAYPPPEVGQSREDIGRIVNDLHEPQNAILIIQYGQNVAVD